MEHFTDIETKIKNKQTLNIDDIHCLLPQREPFLMVDSVLEINIDDKYIKAEKDVKEDEYYFKGHFPDKPIMPGVLIVESLAQTASILGRKKKKKNGIYVFAEIEKAKFLQIVKPNSTLLLEAKIVSTRDPLIAVECVASCNKQIVAKCKIKAFRKAL